MRMLLPGTWDVTAITTASTASAGDKLLISSEFRTGRKAPVGKNQPLRGKAMSK